MFCRAVGCDIRISLEARRRRNEHDPPRAIGAARSNEIRQRRFNGKERNDVEEYCISERWIKVAAGKARDRKGKPLMITLKGAVEVYYRDPAPEAAQG
jgi:hypothetical protein